MNRRAYAPATAPWHLISLRPAGQHDALRRAAARFGARTLAVSPWRLQARDDDATRQRALDLLAQMEFGHDGYFFVYDLQAAVRIRTGETDAEAL